MNILIIDGQGGQLGSQLIRSVISRYPEIDLTAIGTNAAATTSMVKAGAKKAATGENPIIVACRKADVIFGPIGIVIADALLGEITPEAAKAVGQSDFVIQKNNIGTEVPFYLIIYTICLMLRRRLFL